MNLRTTLAVLLLPGVLLVADDQHRQGHDLGLVHFPVSCAPAVQKTFERGAALLHSFWYDEAGKDIFRSDPHRPRLRLWAIGVSP